MPFVKLDTGILSSTIWFDRDARDVFITGLLMAQPQQIDKPLQQIEVGSLENTDFVVPPGWYGFIEAAGPGIVHRAQVDSEAGMAALKRLGMPDPESRSAEFEGRRMIRVNGGYVILNFMKYRDRDYSAAERMRKLRQRRKQDVRRNVTPVTRNVTQAEDREQSTESIESQKHSARKARTAHFSIPSLGEVQAYCEERRNTVDPQQWFNYYTSNGWKVGRNSMKDWRAAVRTWEKNGFSNSNGELRLSGADPGCFKCKGTGYRSSYSTPGKKEPCECAEPL